MPGEGGTGVVCSKPAEGGKGEDKKLITRRTGISRRNAATPVHKSVFHQIISISMHFFFSRNFGGGQGV